MERNGPQGMLGEVASASKFRTNVTLIVCSLILLSVLMPAASLASSIYQGDDVSWGFAYNQRVKVHDREGDWRQAYAEYKWYGGGGNINYVYDNTGANDGRPGKSGYYPSGISHHKTCEDVAGVPDPCNIRWSRHAR